MHPGGEPIADQLARQLSLPEVRLQPELLAEAERQLERERSVRRVTLRALLETAERTEGSFAVCGYDPMQLRAQDGLLWSGAFSPYGRRMARCAVCSVRALCSLRTIPTGRRRCLCRECDKIVTCESLARHRGMVK